MNRLLSPTTAHLAARTMVLRTELATVLRVCHDRSLACAPLRGLALAEQLYGANALRPTGDIDLLVRRQDLPAIAGLLAELDYAPMEHRPGFAGSFSYTLEFAKDRHGWIVVEPHWTLAYPPFADALDMEKVWSRCRRGRVAGVDAWLLGDEDLLAHLCFHVLHHGEGAPGLWWQELDLLIRQAGMSLNWNTFAEIVGGSGQSFLALEALRRLRERFRTPIPRSALTGLAEQGSRTRFANLLAHAPNINGREEFAQFVSLPGLRAKLRYALGLLFPSPAFMKQRYGAQTGIRIGMAYLRRVFRIGWDGMRWAAALLHARSAGPSLSR
jgi:hypothetical protein